VTETYRWVDRAANPAEAATWQDRVNAWPDIAVYKRYVRGLLGETTRLLDVGCGTGSDLRHHESAFGVDRSLVMLARASRTGACIAAADAHHLPFGDAAFDGVRADRVLQHVDQPNAVLGELVRVLAPGGTLVVADPDQGSLVIELPWASASLVARVRDRRRRVQYRNGELARRLPGMFSQLGLDHVSVRGFALTLTDPDDAFGLPTWVRHAYEQGDGDVRDVEDWERAVERARTEPGFLYAVTYLVASGRKPRT
jgi:SAM-dependent methyltransferase